MTGYHATKKINEKSILKDGFKISNSNNFHHWLGSGIYFWEDSYYAVEWNLIDLEKKWDSDTKKYARTIHNIGSYNKNRKK